jgi:HK97 family phage major capsid protein
MNEKEFALLVEKVGEATALKIKAEMEKAQKELDTKIENAMKNNASKEEVKTLIADAIKEANEVAKAAYDKILKEQGEAIADLKLKLKSHGSNGKPLTFAKSLQLAFEEKMDVLKEIIKSGKQDKPFIISVEKAAIDMGEDNTIGSGATQYTMTQNTGIISPIRRRLEKYLGHVSVGSIQNARALWIEETDAQGNPIFIGEADAKIKLSSKWIEQSASVRKIGVYGKVTTEIMDDLPQLISYIKNSLMKRLSVKTEDQLVSGDNVGDNLNGAENLATAFTAGALAATVERANEFDVLTAIALQVEVANGIPTAILIHPSTWAKMKTLKDEVGQPIWKQYVDPISKSVVFEGMEIVTTTAVDAGDFVGGDMSILNVLFRDQITIQIGLDGTDFTSNLKTILVENRLVQFASANDRPCLVTGDFATAMTALELVPVP